MSLPQVLTDHSKKVQHRVKHHQREKQQVYPRQEEAVLLCSLDPELQMLVLKGLF